MVDDEEGRRVGVHGGVDGSGWSFEWLGKSLILGGLVDSGRRGGVEGVARKVASAWLDRARMSGAQKESAWVTSWQPFGVGSACLRH